MRDEQGDDRYRVVVNHEEQYSVWPADREMAPGWRDAGVAGTRDACLRHIEEVWTDMRPASLRRRMAEAGAGADGR
ncbi:MbtH family protein [Streptomyces sp. URMC 123]|uniref:MbtH family protein n=1 Tax=Streptomyces sp. URMC 123 TaxID=3423403 RepID=UPI003F1C0681